MGLKKISVQFFLIVKTLKKIQTEHVQTLYKGCLALKKKKHKTFEPDPHANFQARTMILKP